MPGAGPSLQIGGYGAATSSYGRLITAAEARKLDSLSFGPANELRDFQGQFMDDRQHILARSPGCFSVRVVEAGEAVVVGEDWIGPGTNAAEGALEGCSEDRPGLCFMGDGTCAIVGGKARITAATLYADAGADGTTVLVALIRPKASPGAVVYKAVHVSSAISSSIGSWTNCRELLGSAYINYHAIPIAMLELDSDPKVTDVYWSLETPAIGLPPLDWHPWKIVVYDAAGSRKMQVRWGTVFDGAQTWTVADLGETAITDPTYVWLRVKYYNNPVTSPEFEIAYNFTGFPASSCSYDVISASSWTTLATAGWYQAIIPLGYWDETNGVVQWRFDNVNLPYGRTYTVDKAAGFRWSGLTLEWLKATEYYLNGVLYETALSASTLFTVQSCDEGSSSS